MPTSPRILLDKLVDVAGDVKVNTHDIDTIFHRVDEIRHMFWTLLVIQLVQTGFFIWRNLGR